MAHTTYYYMPNEQVYKKLILMDRNFEYSNVLSTVSCEHTNNEIEPCRFKA